MKNLTITGLCLIISCFVFGQKVDLSVAKRIGQFVFERENPERKNMKIKELIPLGDSNDTLLYIAPFPDNGFAIISADYRNSPILGYCKKGSYNPEIMPPALNYLIESYKHSIIANKKNDNIQNEKTKKKWESTLTKSAGSNLLYNATTTVVVMPLTSTEWGQRGGFNQKCPPDCPAGCTAIAMAQILKYWNCRIKPSGSVEYSGLGWIGGYANIGATTYNWSNMDDHLANAENETLIYDAGVSCLTHYNTDGSVSTPEKARDGFVTNWGISSDANVKWRISHLNDWQDMLEDQLDLGRPILYSGGALFGGGHSWVIDGYNSDGNFYCNWGWYGQYNEGSYSLGDFNPGDQGPFNQYESAIFNVVPVELSGVATPQLAPKTVAYSTSGYTLSIPAAFGATSYQWTTNSGTISGNGTSVTLFSNCSATVQVRAYNSVCNIYSPFTTVSINVNYGPISGPTLVCTTGSTFVVNNLPAGCTILWDKSSNLTLSATSGNTATFKANTNGGGWVSATINSGCPQVILPHFPFG